MTLASWRSTPYSKLTLQPPYHYPYVELSVTKVAGSTKNHQISWACHWILGVVTTQQQPHFSVFINSLVYTYIEILKNILHNLYIL